MVVRNVDGLTKTIERVKECLTPNANAINGIVESRGNYI